MNIEIANRLAELRKKSGLSQEELADKLGLSRQAVSKWERAESSPDTDNLILLANLYGVSLDELLKCDKSVDEIIKDNKEIEAEKVEEKHDRVSISSDGIHVEAKNGDSVHIGEGGIHVNDAKGTYDFEANKRRHKIVGILNGAFFLAALIAYLTLGFIFTGDAPSGIGHVGWSVGWILILVSGFIPSIVDAILAKKPSKVGFFMLGLSVYLFLGMMYGLWHPYWLIIIVGVVLNIVISGIQKAVTGKDDDDDDDDDEKVSVKDENGKDVVVDLTNDD